MSDTLPACVLAFLDAINARDVDRAGECFAPDASYHLLMPHPPVEGRRAIVEALRPSVAGADRVQWDVVTWGVNGEVVFVERIDRFFYTDNEAAIECLGVFTLRNGLIQSIRDYADLATWRLRKAAAQG